MSVQDDILSDRARNVNSKLSNPPIHIDFTSQNKSRDNPVILSYPQAEHFSFCGLHGWHFYSLYFGLAELNFINMQMYWLITVWKKSNVHSSQEKKVTRVCSSPIAPPDPLSAFLHSILSHEAGLGVLHPLVSDCFWPMEDTSIR